MRRLFNDNWEFAEFDLDTSHEEMCRSRKFKNVGLPHDWMIYHVEDLYKNSIGFYKKKFCVNPVEGNTYIIRFEGVYMDCEIYLNGEKIHEWKYGYSTFDVDLTGRLLNGENEIYVVVTYKCPNSRWYSGAGIYRNVYFYELNKAYIKNDGVYLSSEELGGNRFTLFADTEVTSTGFFDGEIKHTVYDKDKNEVASVSGYVPLCLETYTSRLKVEIPNVTRWDLDNPYLYKVVTTLYVDNEITCEVTNTFGFRTIEFTKDEGLFVNHKRVKIYGVCNHHDLGSLGAAVNKKALRRQLIKLKEMGVNSIRTSHNMPTAELMDLADEMGILINSEAFDMWERPKTKYDYGNYFPVWWSKDVTSWVRRDRNHPSLIIFSIGNEIYDTHAGNGYKWNELLKDKVRSLDYRHNAYIGNGSNYMEWEGAQSCADRLELAGYNYGERLYDDHHKNKHPNWCIFGSETSSTIQSRGIYHFPFESRMLTYADGQCSSLGNCTTNWGAYSGDAVIADHRDRDFVAGQYIWTGWDYIGEPTPYFSKNSFFGQIDTAGFLKDSFYIYKAEWTDSAKEPMVHIFPYWDFNDGQIIDVMAYSNASKLELFVNGQSRGKREIDHEKGSILHAQWKVSYEKGEITVVGYDKDNKEIARDTQRSFEDPDKIVLKPSDTVVKADGEDLVFVEISTADRNGNPVMNARNRMKVRVEGPGFLAGLDNGDSTDYEEYKCDTRKLFSGKLLAIVSPTFEPGIIKVTVSSEGLEPEEIEIESVKADIEPGKALITEGFKAEASGDVSVRKIELIREGDGHLDDKVKSAFVKYRLFPSNATFKDITFKALTKDGIEANYVKLDKAEGGVTVNALGDGNFRLSAMCNNGSDVAEIISELEFDITGLGQATLDPYGFISGIQYSEASHEDALSFEGGVFIPTTEESYVSYDLVDFGDFGSDEITIPIFSFDDEVDVKVWEGNYNTGICLGEFTYTAKSIYNTYQPNTFKLKDRIKGTKRVTLSFARSGRFSVKGFSFKKYDKAYSEINALDYSVISGDSFTLCKDRISHIGNNVSIEYDNMDFSKKGVSSISVFGKSNNEKTSIHVLFTNGDVITKQMVEIPWSEDIKEFTLPLKDVRANDKLALVFLPGSDFDLLKFRVNS